MVVMFLAFVFVLLALPCVLMPEQVWKAFNVGDDGSEYGVHDVNLVALSEWQHGLPVMFIRASY